MRPNLNRLEAGYSLKQKLYRSLLFVPDEQPGSSQSIEDIDDYASDLTHEARVAGWKPGIKDAVT